MASLAMSYEVETGVSVNETELKCMAENIYFEGRAEPMVGKIAIGHVVMNRIEDSRFPNTICEVVKEGPTRPSWENPNKEYPIRHRCQFSWYCDGKDDTPKNEKAWRKAQDVAFLVLYDKIKLDVTEGATHYHATYVRPSWAKTKKRTTRIEKHIFYRWEK